jgi:hypothetical protein
MEKKGIKKILDNVLPYISLSQISQQYFGKTRTWMYHKLNEDIVNNTQYQLNDTEIEKLILALENIGSDINKAIGELKIIRNKNKTGKGQYYTINNPFGYMLFDKWIKQIPKYPNIKVLEPFAGSNHIVKLIQQIDKSIVNWTCYDIAPPPKNKNPTEKYKVVKRDTILNFPKGYNVAITNPPYLAHNSATKNNLPYPQTKYDDLYKLCLDTMLNNCKYVAAIIPESFITANLFHDRLFGVISINKKMFENTDCPVCLALFIPAKKNNGDFDLYIGDKYAGSYLELKKYDLSEYQQYKTDWNLTDPKGKIGVRCVDSHKKPNIKFIDGDSINPKKIFFTSRSFTRISGLPENIDTNIFIEECNAELKKYRDNTKDVFLTSFKNLLQKGSKYRRRIDFKTIRAIMNKTLDKLKN